MPLFLAACKLIRDSMALRGWGETARDDKKVRRALNRSKVAKEISRLCAKLDEELSKSEEAD